MDWGARLRAAWRGEVSNADLAAMFAATARLSDLQQALADRRLAADIEHSGNDWRALLAVGPIAGPLWLANALVTLAGALYDTEAPARAGEPAAISAYTHDVVAELLAPIEDIIADVTAALADPGHHTALTTPLRIGPGGGIAGERLAELPPTSCVRGLAAGARRVHTSAAAALAAAKATVAKSPAPDWLASGFRRIDGELQAAGARLDVAELRLTPLLSERGTAPDALAAISRDLWTVANAAVVAGQVIADPHLLPEARVMPNYSAPPPQTAPTFPPRARMPRARPVPLPQIAEGAPSAPPDEPAAIAEKQRPPPPNLSLPTVGNPHGTQPPGAGDPPAHVALPAVGDEAPQPSASRPATPPAASPPHTLHPIAPREPQPRAANDKTETDDERDPFRFPEIG